MGAELAIVPDNLEVLKQAAAAYRAGDRRPAPEAVVSALLQAEKAAKQARSTYPAELLLGQWRLCFTTGTRKLRDRGGIALGKGLYLPRFAPAGIGFASSATAAPLAASNQIQLGGLKLKFTGPAKYLGKKNLLAFDFTQVQVVWGGRSLWQAGFRGGDAKTAAFGETPIAKLPFFAFFLVTEELMAARGRGGGLALWIREQG